MFNLEQAILKWRREMLASGIATPVPLEELECHLRDEIEAQTKSGLSEEDAFNVAIRSIGKGRELRREFKKVEGSRKLARVVILIMGWLAASGVLLYSLFRLEFNWNFINFSPNWNLEAIVEIFGIFISVTSTWFLAKASRDKASRTVSLVACLLMAALVVGTLPAEKLQTVSIKSPPGTEAAMWESIVGHIFSRDEPSPLWYRGGISMLLCVPGVFWILGTRRQRLDLNFVD